VPHHRLGIEQIELAAMPEITTEWRRFEQLSRDALYEILRFRQSIFVVEQSSAYPDLDDLDQDACHLLLRVDAELAGYLRLAPAPLVRIGRVAIASHLRRQGFGRRLVEEALRLARERFPDREVTLAAQIHLVPFYEAFGFVANSDPYDEFGVRHVEMRLRQRA
jgi:ElaA protein